MGAVLAMTMLAVPLAVPPLLSAVLAVQMTSSPELTEGLGEVKAASTAKILTIGEAPGVARPSRFRLDLSQWRCNSGCRQLWPSQVQ